MTYQDKIENNNIRNKTFNFAVRIVNLSKFLIEEKKEFIISKQILRSGTSVGANYREADNAESKADFVHKLAISQKEADETIYWLELLYATQYIEKEQFKSLENDATKILKIIKTIIIKTKQNIKSNRNQ
ncbi:MAG: four helix bundle protein [Bacteroidales bacterium]|nr:four helix bundle protein [Bacteroidales bacterium]